MADSKDAEADQTKTTPAPESTWGATDAAKQAWHDKYDKKKKDEE